MHLILHPLKFQFLVVGDPDAFILLIMIDFSHHLRLTAHRWQLHLVWILDQRLMLDDEVTLGLLLLRPLTIESMRVLVVLIVN